MINKIALLDLIGLTNDESELFNVRHSLKASRLIINSSPQNGLEIVLPRHYDDLWVKNIVVSRRSWIKARIGKHMIERTKIKPCVIHLEAIEFKRLVHYQYGEGQIKVKDTGEKIIVSGDISDDYKVLESLQCWLQDISLRHLVPIVEKASKRHGFSVNKTRVRFLKTIWGSCSINRNISLNRNLLFFPGEIVDYVIHHELTHLKVMDHSETFWRELRKIFPDAQLMRLQLRNLEKNRVPLWAAF